ncbi:MAG: hypothetical protein KIS76_19080 [Pyrinomonadaceae bacterium]|nr:hypothetical protein [Pyrinomonadaceae bacterium]
MIQTQRTKIGLGSTTWKQSFVYDRFGNRTIDAANTTTLSVSNTVTNPAIDPATNRFASGQSYVYDKTGNLINDAEGREFLYDAENHQIEVKNASQQTIGILEFDCDCRR